MKAMVMKRAEALRKMMESTGADAFVIIVDEGTNWQSLYYMSGFRGTAGALAIYKDSHEFVLDPRYAKQGGEQSPFAVTAQKEGLAADIKESLKRHGSKVVCCQASRTYHSTWGLLAEYDAEWRDGTEQIAALRRCKDEMEAGFIRNAADIASDAFIDTLNYVKPGMTELEFQAQMNYKISSLGGEASQGMIVASGVRSAMPHGRASSKRMQSGEWVTVDFSAIYQGYFCDITRNFSIGEPDPRAKELHDSLCEAQAEAVKALRPGAAGTDVDGAARAALQRAGVAEYFTHGLGHGLGIEIHEAPTLSSKKRDIMAVGDVVTVEPGVYIDGWGGLRVEDDYLVTENGCERLTNKLNQCFYLT